MEAKNPNGRIEMFCDGIFAIAITLLILDVKVPPLESVHSVEEVWVDLGRLWPSFFALGLSFIIIFIAWMGHHNLMRCVDRTSSKFLMANGFFMFTIIFIPFPTAFMATYLNTPYAQPAIVFYALCSLLHNAGWLILMRSILKPQPLANAGAHLEYVKRWERGGLMGFPVYFALAVLAWFLPYVSLVITMLIWLFWLYLNTREPVTEAVQLEQA